MTTADASVEVGIVSWPPLWQYWPAYLALARTEQRYHDKGLRFRLLPWDEKDGITDAKLRSEFFKLIADDPTRVFLALCEPLETVAPSTVTAAQNERSAYSRRRIIQRLPLIWRQPHWVLSKPESPWLQASTPSARTPVLWRFPPATTSGDYVANVMGRLVMFENFQGETAYLSEDLAAERELVRSRMRPGDITVTFTPWHLILQQEHGEAGLAVEWTIRDQLRSVMLPGPSRDVTALQVFDQGSGFFVDHLGAQIKSVIAELAATQGELELMEAFFSIDRNFELVSDFLSRNDQHPPWLDRAFLGPALAEYVRLGSYFPYRTVESAISAEIQKRVGEILDGVRDRAVGEIKSAMANFLGGAPEWQALSFRERLHVMDAIPYSRTGAAAEAVWNLLTHPSEWDSRDFPGLLHDLQVKTAPSSPTFQLNWLAATMAQECVRPGDGSHYDKRELCLQEDSGVVLPLDAEATHHCAACAMGGAAQSILRPAAALLARDLRKLNVGVKYRLLTDSGRSRCPLAFQDVRGLVQLFLAEQRPFSADLEHPVEVVMFDGRATRGEPTDQFLVVFGIWWRGETTKKQQTNNTGRKMTAWGLTQTSFGRPVTWVGCWRPRKGALLESRASEGETASPEVAGASGDAPVLAQARETFLKEGFTFGYTAVFSISLGIVD